MTQLERREKVLQQLDLWNIPYTMYTHPPLPTVEIALEYWKDDTLHYQWYEGEDLLEGEGTEPVLEPVDESEEAELARLRAERAEAVSKITVEVDGMVFDGDETSQDRIARTITAATAAGYGPEDTTTWVLHDNTVAEVTIKQLSEALLAAGLKQTELWVIPYMETSDDVQ